MAGGPGSGKSYIKGQLFGIPEKGANIGISGLKSVNSDKQTTSSPTTYEITLNQQACADMFSRDYFQVAIVTENEVDGVSAPSDGSTNNFYIYSRNSSSSIKPKLMYELAPPPGKLEILGGNTQLLSGKITIK